MTIAQQYLKDISVYPLLTPEEELELGRRIADGDEEARKDLINSNLKLVVYLAKSYTNSHLDIMDLIQYGNQGLMTAVDKYNYKLGYKFSTCAVPWIKQAILKGLTDQGKMIRLPAHIYQQLNQMKKAKNELIEQGILNPSDEQLAAKMGIDAEKVAMLKDWKHDAISLNTPLNDEDKNTIEDLVADTHTETPMEYTEKNLMHEKIMKELSKFKERTQIIMKMRYGLGDENDPEEFQHEHTLEEIGDYLKITRERVRQIEKDTLADMRNNWGR